jgi:25S rRNA (uracil2634-N3)-methyltransferase
MRYTKNNLANKIFCLGAENHALLIKAINLGLYKEAKILRENDQVLFDLLCKSLKFDFVAEVAFGRTLLVGEGNMSFSLSLAKKPAVDPRNLTVSVFETHNQLSNEAFLNTIKLKKLGSIVHYNVDSTKLSNKLEWKKFDNIIFQFPHTGSREPIEGRNPNYILVRDFLKSARSHLYPNRKILITTVNSSYYNGIFSFEEAAKKAGFYISSSHPFAPSSFAGYTHTMTNEDESGINEYRKFITHIFRPK